MQFHIIHCYLEGLIQQFPVWDSSRKNEPPLVHVATATIQTVLRDIGTFGPNTFVS